MAQVAPTKYLIIREKFLLNMKYDTVIVGAGVMGSATAYWLSKEEKNVLLIDQFEIENSINASYDFSRIFRYAHSEDEYYINLAVESLKLWKEVEKESGKQLYFNCGLLELCNTKEDTGMKTFHTLKKLGHNVTLIEKTKFPETYPQFKNINFGVLDRNGGLIEANSAVKTFIRLAKQNGVTIRENEKIIDLEDNKLILENGESIKFEKLVLTCGSWIKKLTDIKLPIKLTKGQMLYLKPKDSSAFAKENFPCFVFVEKKFYGIPIHGIDGMKFSVNYESKEVDSPDIERSLSDDCESRCRDMLKKYIPEIADSEIVHTRVCLHDSTPDGDFVIDKVKEKVVIGCGFSGHAFKFAPLIGKILSDLVLRGRTTYDISRFKLDRF